MITIRLSLPVAIAIALVVSNGLPARAQEDTDLTTATSDLFSGSGNCALCHVSSRDALIAEDGTDLSPPLDWRATMMANAARDPLWQAMVEIEAEEAPHLREVIENTCTRCHTPMGQAEAIFQGAESYSLDEARSSELAMDGVSCTACHQIQPANLGAEGSDSGGFIIDDSRTIFGPYTDPLVRPMQNSVNYTPAFGEHMNRSALCATCHDLFTPFLDDDGQVAGTFPEQVPYREWLNSIYPAAGEECQSCHMPRLDEPVKIARIPTNLAPRTPFFRHIFVGGNTYMQSILREQAAELGVTATDEHFTMTTDRTREQLRERTASIDADANLEDDTLELNIRVENLCGHKFPTGIPLRRAWLHLRVTNERGEIIFESGAPDAEGRLDESHADEDEGYEPHRDLIDSPDQVQIYEAVFGDVNGDRTFTLLRAASYLKDNRLPPRGFVSSVEDIAVMAITGEAATDSDFNRDEDTEGTGTDTVTYIIDTAGQLGRLEVEAELLFQSLSPTFIDHVLEHHTPAVERFARYYAATPNTPETIATATLVVDLGTGGLPRYRRGDANADGTMDLADAVFILGHLFIASEEPPCLESADVNDSGDIDVSDAVYSLLHLFAGGLEPPSPFSECGIALPDDGLDCESFPPCTQL